MRAGVFLGSFYASVSEKNSSRKLADQARLPTPLSRYGAKRVGWSVWYYT